MADRPSPEPPPSAEERLLAALGRDGTAHGLVDLVRRTGLHENAVRRNLARLAERGRVVVERAPATGGRGRPALQYRAAGEPATPYRELLPLVLSLFEVPGEASPDGDAAYRAGEEHGRSHAPPGDAVEAVMASLAALGFAPQRDAPASGDPDDGAQVTLRACPFADMIGRPGGRRLCALHHGIVAGVAAARGGRVDRFDALDPHVAQCHLSVRAGEGALV